MESRITKHVFVYGTERYFRGGAVDIGLGSYGKKVDPIGAKAYLARHEDIPRRHLKGHVEFVSRITVDWSRVTSASFGGSGRLKYFGMGAKGGHKLTLSKAKSADLELLKFRVSPAALQRILNQDAPRVRTYLKDEGNDARIASEILVCVEGELATAFSTTLKTRGSFSTNLSDAMELEVSAKNSASVEGGETITLDPGSTFAYMLHKVGKWDRDRVEKLVEDQKGMG